MHCFRADSWCAVFLAMGLLLFLSPGAHATVGQVDSGFRGQFAGFDQNGWDPSPVRAMAVQTDGKTLVGGILTNVSGVYRLRMARLLPDGSLDTAFICHVPPAPPEPNWFNTTVSALAVQPDGLILVGGNFTNLWGVTRPGLARITTNALLDTSFSPNIEAQSGSPFLSQPLHIHTITLQPDGGILIAGSFSHVGGVPRESVARLFPDGSLDPSFDPDPPRRSPASTERRNVYAALREPDGNLVIGGTYGVERLGLNGDRMARIGAFRTNGVSASVRALVRQTDGSLVVGGGFDSLGGDPSTSAVARLRHDFTVDTAFSPRVRRSSTLYSDGVNALHLQPDGMIVVGGSFDRVGNATVQGLARLQGNGSYDDTFDAEPFLPARNYPPYNDPFGENGYIQTMTALPDGGLLVAGNFRELGGTAVTNVARLWRDGSPDTAIRVNAGGAVLNPTVDREGRLLATGGFTNLNGLLRRGFARLYANGTVDPDINLPLQTTGALGYASAVAVQKDGHYVVGGHFTTAGGYIRTNLYRHYRNTGLADLGFEPHPGPIQISGFDGGVFCLALDNEENVYAGGIFNTIAGSNRTSFARLRPTGGLDSSFSNVVFTSPEPPVVNRVMLQTDQRVLAVGVYTGVNGIARLGLVRLLTNGVVDTSFAVTATLSGAQNLIYDAVPRVDGKLVVRGTFDTINGAPRGRVAILNANGTVDPAVITPPFARSNNIALLAQQTDGNILIAGNLTAYDIPMERTIQIGLYSTNLVLLTNLFPVVTASNLTGSLYVTAVLEKDGSVIVGGNATHINGVGVTGLVRVLNTPATSLLYAVNSGRIRWARGGSTPEAHIVFFQLSTNNGVTWTELGAGTRTNGGWELGGLNLPLKGHLRGLARIPGVGVNVGQIDETVAYRLNFFQVVGAWMNFVTGTTNFLPTFTTFSADFDGDFISNGDEFAFGTMPNDQKSGPDPMRFAVTPNNTVDLLAPSAEVGLVSKVNFDGTRLRGLFTRRADYVGSGLTYVPEFSTDMRTWRAAEATPEVLDVSGEYELVGIPLPGEVDGLPVQHFRVRILYTE